MCFVDLEKVYDQLWQVWDAVGVWGDTGAIQSLHLQSKSYVWVLSSMSDSFLVWVGWLVVLRGKRCPVVICVWFWSQSQSLASRVRTDQPRPQLAGTLEMRKRWDCEYFLSLDVGPRYHTSKWVTLPVSAWSSVSPVPIGYFQHFSILLRIIVCPCWINTLDTDIHLMYF